MERGGFGPKRISIELTNICNLHCSYCLRDEDALYHTPANFFSPDLLNRILSQAQDVMGVTAVAFTGGEPTLHPEFDRILGVSAAKSLKTSFVTNGWHFEKVWPSILANRNSITHVAFSLDGITAETHDAWRGAGSFERVVRAFSRCYAAKIPFAVKVAIRRDTIEQLEQIALFAARFGAYSLNFAHIMPTSNEVEETSALSYVEREEADQEIANLSRIFRMKIGIDVGYHNRDVSPPCSALAGVSCNVDYRGRLSLCCNLAGFRGASGESDVVADLSVEDFAPAFRRLSEIAARQVEARRNRLEALDHDSADPYVSSPCLFCLDTFGKLPWRAGFGVGSESRSLPVLQSR
ncbi:MAG TPA: radical SAM protein [Pyrinomonadaceae bacterium]|nr:radical SAM protein [Pyrinomonadaceae bacterium]